MRGLKALFLVSGAAAALGIAIATAQSQPAGNGVYTTDQATIGATAPFVGLLGTVWGIYHALTGLASGGGVTIDRIAGPVGEALVMTAAGLAVAIPAVVAYNVLGRVIDRIEADLEGFAHDLRAWLVARGGA